MAYGRRRRFSSFHRTQKPAVKQTAGIQAGRRTRCQHCLQHIELGQPFARLQLQKRYRTACVGCGTVPKRAKRYHEACLPPDINLAMGFDPNKQPAGYVPPVHQHVAPPPVPLTFGEASLAALASLEKALILRAQRPGALTPELEAAFKKFQGIKARVLRPGTPAEGEVATFLAIQHIVKMVFVN